MQVNYFGSLKVRVPLYYIKINSGCHFIKNAYSNYNSKFTVYCCIIMYDSRIKFDCSPFKCIGQFCLYFENLLNFAYCEQLNLYIESCFTKDFSKDMF